MAIAFVATRRTVTYNAASSIVPTPTAAVANSNSLFLCLNYPIAATDPTAPSVSSVGVPTGETNAWTRILNIDAPAESGGHRIEVWAIKVARSGGWSTSSSFTVTWSATTGTGPGIASLQEFSGITDPTSVYVSNSATDTAPTGGTASIATNGSVTSGDLALSIYGQRGVNTTTEDSTNNSGGSWSTASSNSAGTGSTGAQQLISYKVPTASGSQTHATTYEGPPSSNTLAIIAVREVAITNISISRTFKWNVLASISISRIFKWNARAVFSTNRNFKWNVAIPLTIARVFKWNVRLSVSTITRTFKWNVIAGVLITRTFKWNVRSVLITSRTFKWNVLISISISRTFLWRVFAPWTRILDVADVWIPINENDAVWTPDTVNSTPWT